MDSYSNILFKSYKKLKKLFKHFLYVLSVWLWFLL